MSVHLATSCPSFSCSGMILFHYVPCPGFDNISTHVRVASRWSHVGAQVRAERQKERGRGQGAVRPAGALRGGGVTAAQVRGRPAGLLPGVRRLMGGVALVVVAG